MRVRGLSFSNIASKDQLLAVWPVYQDTFQGDARRTKVQAEHSAAQEALRTLRVGAGKRSMHCCTGYSRAGVQFFVGF